MIAIFIIRVVHLAVIVFVLSAWALPYLQTRIVHLFFIPLMILHWKTNRDTCVLTELEGKLAKDYDGARLDPQVASSMSMRHSFGQAPKKEEGQFTRRLFQALFFGWTPSDAFLKRFIYVTVWSAWCISLVYVVDYFLAKL